MKRFWLTFRRHIRPAVFVPVGVIGFDLLIAGVRWAAQQIAGEAFLNQFDAWARSHNVSALLLKAMLFAENSPVAASVIFAAVAVIYGAVRSEYELRKRPAAPGGWKTDLLDNRQQSWSLTFHRPPRPTNIVYIRDEMRQIDNPLEVNFQDAQDNQVEALLLLFHNAPLVDGTVKSAEVTASIEYKKAESSDAVRVDRQVSDERIILAGWVEGHRRRNRISFDVNAIHDLLLLFQWNGKFYALEEREEDGIRTPEIGAGTWDVTIQFTTDGRLNERGHRFSLAVGNAACSVLSV